MIELPCPWCGPRNVTEFRYVGEVTPRPDPATATPEHWRAYLYLRRNARGVVQENWYHTAGCRRYFRVHRDTASNAVVGVGADVWADARTDGGANAGSGK